MFIHREKQRKSTYAFASVTPLTVSFLYRTLRHSLYKQTPSHSKKRKLETTSGAGGITCLGGETKQLRLRNAKPIRKKLV